MKDAKMNTEPIFQQKRALHTNAITISTVQLITDVNTFYVSPEETVSDSILLSVVQLTGEIAIMPGVLSFKRGKI